MKNKVVIYSYYSPEELTGIGKYNGEMMGWLKANGFEITSFSSAPFYPKWKLYSGFSNAFYSKNKSPQYATTDIRSWVYIPSSPSSIRKIISELSFFLSSSFAILLNIRKIRKSGLIIVICPPFFISLFLLLIRQFSGFKILHHIQDLQVDAAQELKLLPSYICKILAIVERWVLRRSDYVSTISQGMKKKLEQKSIHKEVLLLPNWSDINRIRPETSTKWLHDKLGIDNTKKLIVYSGNLGEKQGLEIIVEAASKLQNNDSLHFVILGEGLFRERLIEVIKHEQLPNITIAGLVPLDALNRMLNDSFIQLVIQKSSAADSFLPSKLTNILASGCASIVTANPGTSLYSLLEEDKSAIIIEPENGNRLAEAIDYLFENEEERKRIKFAARKWAEENLSISKCISPLLGLIN